MPDDRVADPEDPRTWTPWAEREPEFADDPELVVEALFAGAWTHEDEQGDLDIPKTYTEDGLIAVLVGVQKNALANLTEMLNVHPDMPRGAQLTRIVLERARAEVARGLLAELRYQRDGDRSGCRYGAE